MEVNERIINLLSEKLGYDKCDIKEEKVFTTDLGLDSLDMIEIIMGIEHEFGLKIDDADIEDVRTVGEKKKKVNNLRMGR